MMNGLRISEDSAAHAEALDFEAGQDPSPSKLGNAIASPSDVQRQESFGERRKREHEEYKKKRDADPAFIPTRGAFFMHDQRSASAGPNGTKILGRGRGRGRDVVGGPFSPAK